MVLIYSNVNYLFDDSLKSARNDFHKFQIALQIKIASKISENFQNISDLFVSTFIKSLKENYTIIVTNYIN